VEDRWCTKKLWDTSSQTIELLESKAVNLRGMNETSFWKRIGFNGDAC